MALDPRRWTRTISQSLLVPSVALLACLSGCSPDDGCEGTLVGGVFCIPGSVEVDPIEDSSEPAPTPAPDPTEPTPRIDRWFCIILAIPLRVSRGVYNTQRLARSFHGPAASLLWLALRGLVDTTRIIPGP